MWLDRLRAFFETTHNTRFLIETLAMNALLDQARGRDEKAVETLGSAVELAQPGGLIRVFADLDPGLGALLQRLDLEGNAARYVGEILAAVRAGGKPARGPSGQPVTVPDVPSALTDREIEILALFAKGMTNKEIGYELYISAGTVKRHGENLYSKLGVHGRKQAVERARGLGIL